MHNPATPLMPSPTNLARFVLSSCLTFMGVVFPAACQAEDWQAYRMDSLDVHELDAASVRVIDGLVHFQYRERYLSGNKKPADMGRNIDAVADCTHRRQADVTREPLELRSVYENTLSAFQLDFACRLAGLDFKTYRATSHASLPDWRFFQPDMAIDLNSLDVRDGRVFYSTARLGQEFASEPNRVVVDCAHRLASNVVGRYYTLQPLVEGRDWNSQLELACKLGNLSLAPGPPPDPVDFSVPVLITSFMSTDTHPWLIDVDSLVTRDGLVHFVYSAPYLADPKVVSATQHVHAVVDCATHRRSDDVGGKVDLQPIIPNTRGDLQVRRVCKLAAKKVVSDSDSSPP